MTAVTTDFLDSRLGAVPLIGEIIDADRAIGLCDLFRLFDVANDIRISKNLFIPFRFDGVSGMSESVAREIFGVSKLDSIRSKRLEAIALIHDLQYAFGRHGDENARRESDRMFRENLKEYVVPNAFHAWLGWAAVRALGGNRDLFKTNYLWGFARVGYYYPISLTQIQDATL